MKEQKSPLLLIAYKRTDTLGHALSALAKCKGLNDRPVFAYLDGARSPADETDIENVHKMFVDFKSTVCPELQIVRREKNYGCRENIVSAITEVINKYGRLIIVEDDIVVSKYFLEYMDEALDFYQDDKRIWGINAYRNRFAKIPADYQKDIYLHQRNMCWGWGTWADRWNAVDFDMAYWSDFKSDPKNVERLKAVSFFLPGMIESEYNGLLKTWDVQVSLHIVNENMYCVEPRYCMTRNCGCEGGGGMHCGPNSAVSTQPFYNFKPRLAKDLMPNEKIMQSLCLSDFNPSILARVWRKLLRLLWSFCKITYEPREIR